MRSIFDAKERARLHQRIATLTETSPARWGRMTALQMTCHLYDALISSEGPSPPPGSALLSRFPVKQLVIYILPWPKGKLQSPPDLLATKPGVWFEDLQRLHQALDRVGARGTQGSWPASEVFGPLTGADWGALLRTHIDHHLKQFGV